MSAAKTKAQGIIDENPVVSLFDGDGQDLHMLTSEADGKIAVFSKSWCPYCAAAKKLLSEQGANFHTVELDQVDDGDAMQDALEEMTQQRSVPNIFISKKHIGGNSELQAKKSQLPQLLKDANAI